MAGRPKVVRLKQSLVNYIDNRTAAGPMKMGLPPSIGVTRYYWYNYATQCNTKAGAPKKSYDNMVFLSINPAQTPVTAGFRPTTNYNYSYNAPPGVGFYDANAKFDNHFLRPYYNTYYQNNIPKYPNNGLHPPPSKHMTGFPSNLNQN
jgi:hypothetical protein